MRDMGLTHGGFYKHFESKEELLLASLSEAFRETLDRLEQTANEAGREPAWKAIVKTYLSEDHSSHAEKWCPMTALSSEFSHSGDEVKDRIFHELRNYKDRMVPFMPGRRTSDKENAFFTIFSTMIGAIQIARLLPEPAMREIVLANARKFLLQSFD
jgi:TetR/AcrR family transcriptional repressor of nem operon